MGGGPTGDRGAERWGDTKRGGDWGNEGEGRGGWLCGRGGYARKGQKEGKKRNRMPFLLNLSKQYLSRHILKYKNP